MHKLVKPVLRTGIAGDAGCTGHSLPRKGPDEETQEDDDGLALPVNPDQGTPLIPDEEGLVTVPI